MKVTFKAKVILDVVGDPELGGNEPTLSWLEKLFAEDRVQVEMTSFSLTNDVEPTLIVTMRKEREVEP
jgi:hypothetical protein